MSNFKGSVSISRNSNDQVNIRIHDSASGTEFVDIQMTLENYALLITGLSRVEATGDVRGLDRVGKHRVIEQRSVVCPLVDVWDKKVFRQWLIENCQEEGWELNSYLDSQTSVSNNKDGTKTLNYSVVKYVEDAS
jgi:hypothetical protein